MGRGGTAWERRCPHRLRDVAPASCRLSQTLVCSLSACSQSDHLAVAAPIPRGVPTPATGITFEDQGRLRRLGRTHKGCGYQNTLVHQV